MIDIEYLKQLLEIFDASSVNDLRLEEDGTSIRLTKTPKIDSESSPSTMVYHAPPTGTPQSAEAPSQTGGAVPPTTAPEEIEESDGADDANYHEVRSPIVGTFYSAPSPDSDPFVEVGSTISEGEALCIVEAMKLMNEIESDVTGRVAKILVENAQPVEYNQVLFLIETS